MNYSNFLTVRELTVLIKYNLENDIRFKNIIVKGEISNLKIHPTGHWYFTLKDPFSKISCVMFASYAKNIKIKINEGMQVIITGSIGVYENAGNYQLYVTSIQPDGLGVLYLQYEQLKKKLQDEGLFDEKYKKSIPSYPMRIGVVSASSGAAIHDIFTTIDRRWPICEKILIPASVQGLNAAPTIVKALEIADNMNFDVIIIARGGGSLEDLWPFNEEIVARAIFKMKTPIVSGVGHEVDFTITDFVSDKRAPTPTGAAELVTPNINEVYTQILNFKNRIQNDFNNLVKYKKQLLDNFSKKNIFINPEFMYANKDILLDSFKNRLINNYNKLIFLTKNNYQDFIHRIENSYKNIFLDLKIKNQDYYNKLNNLFNNKILNNENNFKILVSKLDTLSPLKIISRGYSIVSKEEKIIKDTKNVNVDDIINIKFKNGNIDTKVIKINK